MHAVRKLCYSDFHMIQQLRLSMSDLLLSCHWAPAGNGCLQPLGTCGQRVPAATGYLQATGACSHWVPAGNGYLQALGTWVVTEDTGARSKLFEKWLGSRYCGTFSS
eukprot:1148949-Pelagomonas_calceolata.AAC.7